VSQVEKSFEDQYHLKIKVYDMYLCLCILNDKHSYIIC